MGLKTIAALRQEMWKQTETLHAFTRAAQPIVEEYAKLQAARAKLNNQFQDMEKLKAKHIDVIKKLDPLGIREFEAYKQHLLGVFNSWDGRPLPTKPLEAVVEKKRKEVDAAVAERVKKLQASFPSEVKPGMVFKFDPTGALYEITSQKEQATNTNLKGDAAWWYETKREDGSKSRTSLADLKKSYKFIKA